MAMTTRWFIPPESWCGYRPITRRGSEICTFSSIACARSWASSSLTPCSVNTSATWSPMRIVGFSAEVGFWYTIDTCVTRSLRTAASLIASRSSPATLIEPLLTRPLRGRYLSAAYAAVDLPQPDSPTSPNDSPGAISRLTPRSTCFHVPRTM